MRRAASTAAALALSAAAWAGGPARDPAIATYGGAYAGMGMAVADPSAAMTDAPAGLAGDRYDEVLAYGAHVKRSYVPGYPPKTSSLFENPREYPSSVGRLADTYLYSSTPGWFFGSPNGYQSSVPPESEAYAYFSGQIGITSDLLYGYPRGQRVIEPVLIPYGSYAEPGGFYITGGNTVSAISATSEMGGKGSGMKGMAPAAPMPLPTTRQAVVERSVIVREEVSDK